jgi:NhaP-type Na+/H+ or K+/H+ antiporter
MRRRRPNRYDYDLSLLGILLSYLLLILARQQGWSAWQSLGLLISASIPIGLALGWLKSRLQTRFRKVR